MVTPTQDVKDTLRRFAVRLSKRKGTQAAGCWSALHGRIDTRRDAMDKDRIFRRMSDAGDSLMSSVHLVLWIDVSGSFSESQETLNRILAAASEAMGMSGGKLDVDVVKMGTKAEVAKPNEWEVECCTGNAIDRTYHKAWLMTRRKDRRNIDIVVFDGDAKSDDGGRSENMPDGTPVEAVIWNSPDCYIVSDSYNRRYFDRIPRAHKTYIGSGYAEKLQKGLLEMLDRIL